MLDAVNCGARGRQEHAAWRWPWPRRNVYDCPSVGYHLRKHARKLHAPGQWLAGSFPLRGNSPIGEPSVANRRRTSGRSSRLVEVAESEAEEEGTSAIWIDSTNFPFPF